MCYQGQTQMRSFRTFYAVRLKPDVFFQRNIDGKALVGLTIPSMPFITEILITV